MSDSLCENGYPDDGNSIYSNKLSYDEWFDLNVTRRIRLNNIEQICFMAPLNVSIYTLIIHIVNKRFLVSLLHFRAAWNVHIWAYDVQNWLSTRRGRFAPIQSIRIRHRKHNQHAHNDIVHVHRLEVDIEKKIKIVFKTIINY